MTAFVIGLGIVWLVTALSGKDFKVTGFGGILLAIGICYGLGSLVLLLLKR
jgi:hypothetical protein